ncbi:MAG: glycosyltransferase [Proteobacteria bacterium]|nr:glycosyltransferase [Pseudomonadota bacterium]
MLTVGRLSEEKGASFTPWRHLPESRIRGANIQYRVVGDGPQERRLRNCVAEFGLEGCVEFVGKPPRDKLFDEYVQRTCFCCPVCVARAGESACVVQEALLSRL